jgi:uncharacterized protein YxjI
MGHGNTFDFSQYTVRRKILTLIGAKFHVYDPEGHLVLYSKMKGFRLREDIRLYTGEDMTEEVLTISTRNVIDFAAAYDVADSESGEKIGTLRRKGLKSMFRDEWQILDPNGTQIGLIREDSGWLAALRRFVEFAALLSPQKYDVFIGETHIGRMQQHFNPFVMKLTVDFSPDTEHRFDRRLGLAAAVLFCAVEGKQN